MSSFGSRNCKQVPSSDVKPCKISDVAVVLEKLTEPQLLSCQNLSSTSAASSFCRSSHVTRRIPTADNATKSRHSFSCGQCDFVGRTRNCLRIHNNSVHESTETDVVEADESSVQNSIDCPEDIVTAQLSRNSASNATAANSQFFDESLKTSPRVNLHVCQICRKAFRTRGALALHARAHKASKESSRFGCGKCTYRTDRRANLMRHIEHIHDARAHKASKESSRFGCEKCTYRTDRRANLIRHMEHIHGNIAAPNNATKSRRSFSCGQCDFVFHTRNSLLIHNNSVHESTEFDDVKPGDKSENISHTEGSVAEQLPLVQKNSDSILAAAGKANKTITGENMHVCQICRKEFRLRCSLALHMRAHKASKESLLFHCGKCTFHSDDRASLMRHISSSHRNRKTHNRNIAESSAMTTGRQSYSCSRCDYVGITRNSLRTHIYRVHKSTETSGDVCYSNSLENISSTCSVDADEDQRSAESQVATEQSLAHEALQTANNLLSPSIVMQNEDPISSSDVGSDTPGHFVTHYGRVHQGTAWKCEQCDFVTPHEGILHRHLSRIHGQQQSIGEILNSTLIEVKSDLSQTSVSCNYSSIADGSANQPQTFNCKKCNFVCDTLIRLTSHVRRFHKSESRESCMTASFTCRRCGFVTYTKRAISGHHYFCPKGIRRKRKQAPESRPGRKKVACRTRALKSVVKRSGAIGRDEMETTGQLVSRGELTKGIEHRCTECDFEALSGESLDMHMSCVHGRLLEGCKREEEADSLLHAANCKEYVEGIRSDGYKSEDAVEDNSCSKYWPKSCACSECGIVQSFRYEITSHCKKVHGCGSVLKVSSLRSLSVEPCDQIISHPAPTGVYVCGFCPFRCDDINSFKSHQCYKPSQTSHRYVNKTCDTCGVTVDSLEGLQQHFDTPGKCCKWYVCHNCKKFFMSSSHLDTHVRQKCGRMRHYCKFCRKYFKTFTVFSKHMSMHSGTSPHLCSLCGTYFTSAFLLQRHVKIFHPDGLSKSVIEDESTSLVPEVNEPSSAGTATGKLTCKFCYKTGLDSVVLKKHIELKHRLLLQKRGYECPRCSKSYSGKVEVLRHFRTVHAERPFHCTQCAYRAPDRNALKQHLNTKHSSNRPFVCATCGRAFKTKGNLDTHERTHTGEKKFCCDACGRRFAKRRTLQDHARLHSGEKPFNCDHCGKSFTTHTQLKEHIVCMHTETKQFSCTVCQWKFPLRKAMRRHVKNRHGKQYLN